MIQFHKGLMSVCLILLLSFSIFDSEQAKASYLFHMEGEVFGISRQWINVDDNQLPVMANVKVNIKGKKNPPLLSIKEGDFVRVEIIKYNGKLYVDRVIKIDQSE